MAQNTQPQHLSCLLTIRCVVVLYHKPMDRRTKDEVPSTRVPNHTLDCYFCSCRCCCWPYKTENFLMYHFGNEYNPNQSALHLWFTHGGCAISQKNGEKTPCHVSHVYSTSSFCVRALVRIRPLHWAWNRSMRSMVFHPKYARVSRFFPSFWPEGFLFGKSIAVERIFRVKKVK